MIEIRTLDKAQLEDFIRSAEFSNLPFLPISRHRALSHIKNPRAGDDDVLLLLAYEGDTLVGYLGNLPDRLFYRPDAYEACAWLSCMWIDEGHRGKKIAQQLLDKSFEVWRQRILVTEFTVAAKKLYDKTGWFEDLKINKGIRLYLRSDLQRLLPPKKELFARYKPVLGFIDLLANTVLDLRFLFVWRQKFNIEVIASIDEETAAFIRKRQEGQVFRRGPEELDWMLQNPWILEGEENEDSRRYHFSSVDRSFAFYALKLRDGEGRMTAFLVLSKRDRSLKLPYCYTDPETIPLLADLIEEHLLRWRISTFTCFHAELVRFMEKQDTIALFKKPVYRHYIISKKLKALLEDTSQVAIQDGDADAAFT